MKKEQNGLTSDCAKCLAPMYKKNKKKTRKRKKRRSGKTASLYWYFPVHFRLAVRPFNPLVIL